MGGYQGKVYNTPEEAKEFVKSTVNDHPVVLFTKRFSPYCYKATSSFKSLGVAYEEILLSGRSDCQTIQDVLLEMTGARTVPRVFVHQKCIGGGDETKALFKQGKLKDLVDNKDGSAPAEGSSAPAENAPAAEQEPVAEQEPAAPTQEETPAKEDSSPAKEEAPAQEVTSIQKEASASTQEEAPAATQEEAPAPTQEEAPAPTQEEAPAPTEDH